ncbi:MAG: pilus assembly protein TadG-related protein [Syntrophotaleaceae bacterium]
MKTLLVPTPLGEKGAVLVLVAFLLILLLGIAAFALDFGYRHVVKNELQNAADAAALAGARELSKIYETTNIHELTGSEKATIVNAVQNTALTNYAGDEKDLDIDASDILFGHWEPNTFSAPSPTPDAIKVTVRRESVYNSGPIKTIFGGLFGIDRLAVNARATAALTGPSSVPEGALPIPVGIGKSWFDPSNWEDEGKGFCDQDIKMYPTGGLEGCAAWHIYQEPVNNASASDLRG